MSYLTNSAQSLSTQPFSALYNSNMLGIDHKRLTFYHNGIQRRLTDVHGEVVKGLLT